MTATIRPYQRVDKDACLALFDGNVPRYFDASERAAFDEFLDLPRGEYFTLFWQDRVAGCGGFSLAEEGLARFTWGMVDQALHGEGLGKMLAEYRLQAITESGDYSGIELSTTPMIAPFFHKFGFVDQGLEKNGFAPGMDLVRMMKTLD